MRNLKRLTSMFLALVLVVMCLPVEVFADSFGGYVGGYVSGSAKKNVSNQPGSSNEGLYLAVSPTELLVQPSLDGKMPANEGTFVTLAQQVCSFDPNMTPRKAASEGVWLLPSGTKYNKLGDVPAGTEWTGLSDGSSLTIQHFEHFGVHDRSTTELENLRALVWPIFAGDGGANPGYLHDGVWDASAIAKDADALMSKIETIYSTNQPAVEKWFYIPDKYGIGHATSGSLEDDLQTLQYFMNNQWGDNANGDPRHAFLSYSLLLYTVAMKGGQTAYAQGILSELINYMSGRAYKVYIMSVTPCCRHDDQKDAFIGWQLADTAMDRYKVTCKGLAPRDRSEYNTNSTNSAFENLVGDKWGYCGSMVCWGQSKDKATAAVFSNGEVFPAAAVLRSINTSQFKAFVEGLTGKTLAELNMSTDQNSITAGGQTFKVTKGTYWLGLGSSITPPPSPPPIYKSNTKTGQSAEDLPVGTFQQGVVVTPKDVLAVDGAYNEQITVSYTMDFNPLVYKDNNNPAVLHEGTGNTAATQLKTLYTWYTQESKSVEIQKNIDALKNLSSTEESVIKAKNFVTAHPLTVGGGSGTGKSQGTSYKDGSVKIKLFVSLSKDTGVSGAEAPGIVSKTAGYSGNGVNETTNTWGPNHTGDVPFDPTSPANADYRASRGEEAYNGRTGEKVAGFKESFAVFASQKLQEIFGDSCGVEMLEGNGVGLVVHDIITFVETMDSIGWRLQFDVPFDLAGNVDASKSEVVTCWGIGGSAIEINCPTRYTTVHVDPVVQDTYEGDTWVSSEVLVPQIDYTVLEPNTDGSMGWQTTGVSDLKQDYMAVTGKPVKKPTYYSEADPYPHVEMNQGTINQGDTHSTGKYNSMTGTPTTTFTENNAGLNGWNLQDTAGHYYQYFAAGGTEFVVEFDGEVVKDQTAERKFKFKFGEKAACKSSTTSHVAAGAHTSGDPPSPCSGEHDCPHGIHYTCNTHNVGTNDIEFTIKYTGLSYIKITNLKVWQLKAARVDGTRELMETDSVTAEVCNDAPGISYNIAGTNTAAAGRVVYEAFPHGTSVDNQYITSESTPDSLVFDFGNDNTCGTGRDTNRKRFYDALKGKKNGAYLVSDYIVLHTSNGTQAVLYYEQPTKTSTDILSGEPTSTVAWTPTTGDTLDTVSYQLSTDTVEFEVKEYEDLWEKNPLCAGSTASPMTPEDITYGGYNGNYQNASLKYKSSGKLYQFADSSDPSGWTNWSKTQAAMNKSGVFTKAETGVRRQLTTKPSSSLRIMRDGLVIPDDRVNGLYEFTYSDVFYEQIVNTGVDKDKFPTFHGASAQPRYGNRVGFVMKASYANAGDYDDVCNGVVVFDPLACEAVIVPLEDVRDQRYGESKLVDRNLTYACPGDENCEFQVLSAHTGQTYLHNENCYTVAKYVSHTDMNAHKHTDACGGISTVGWMHVHCSNCMRPDSECTGEGCNLCATNRPFSDGSRPNNLVKLVKDDTFIGPDGQTHKIAWGEGRYVFVHNGYTCGGHHVEEGCYHASTDRSYCTVCFLGSRCTQYNATFVMEYSGYTCGNLPLNTHVCTPVTIEPPGTVCSGTRSEATPYCWYQTNMSCQYRQQYAYSSNAESFTIDWCSGWERRPEYDYSTGTACKETSSVMLTCSDPHHMWDSYWKVYTYGLLHVDGTQCDGRTCTNTTDICYPGGKTFTLEQLSKGSLVKHASGNVHLTCNGTGPCSYCGMMPTETLFSVMTDTSRTVTQEEINKCEHYTYGDTRCWKPCMNSANHTRKSNVEIDGQTVGATAFINLDWPFTVYFPNTGVFPSNGADTSLNCSPKLGKGYEGTIDTTEWMSHKWVIFPFDVVYNGTSYRAGSKVQLEVYKEWFEFYCPLENSELAGAEVVYGASAINSPTKNAVVDARRNENCNTRLTTCQGHIYSRPHDIDRRTWVDVVGRIGALTMNDVGDFRYANLFKKVADGWLVPNVIRRVNPAAQYTILTDPLDIRGVPFSQTQIGVNPTDSRAQNAPLRKDGDTRSGNANTNTYGTFGFNTYRDNPLRRNFPLRPSLLLNDPAHPEYTQSGSMQKALASQPMRVGYTAYMDFTTLGNYYGLPIQDSTADGEGRGAVTGYNSCKVIPHYFRLNVDTGSMVAADAYMYRDGKPVLVNSAMSDVVIKDGETVMIPGRGDEEVSEVSEKAGADEQSRLNWTEETNRRNYFETEKNQTDSVYKTFGVGQPYGASYLYGTYDNLMLMGRNRTSIGSKRTYSVSTDPSSKFVGIRYNLQGARWHFGVGLPSSTVFVESGKSCTDANIKAFVPDSTKYVIGVALEIYAEGDVWDLIYDGKNINSQSLTVANGGKSLTNVHPHYPTTPGANPFGNNPAVRDEEMPVVAIFSINHSSKEDVNVAGTH